MANTQKQLSSPQSQKSEAKAKGPLEGMLPKIKIPKLPFNFSKLKERFENLKLQLQALEFFKMAIGLLAVVTLAGLYSGYAGSHLYDTSILLTKIADGLKNAAPLLMIALCAISTDKSRRLSDLGWVTLAICLPQTAYWSVWLALILDLVGALEQRGYLIGSQTALLISTGWTVSIPSAIISGIVVQSFRVKLQPK